MSKKNSRTKLIADGSRVYLDRCKFYVDTNDLIDMETISLLLSNLSDEVIDRLNDIINSISFFIGTDDSKNIIKGIVRYSTYELNFGNMKLTFYISKIFKLGYESWITMAASRFGTCWISSARTGCCRCWPPR